MPVSPYAWRRWNVPATPHPHGRGAVWGSPELHPAGPAIILLHGRGGSAEDILGLAPALALPGASYLAPDAVGHTWYPQRFIAPRAANQPFLDSALARIAELTAFLEAAGVPRERLALGGFSQGACLALEFVSRNPGRYAGVFALSGGLIDPPGPPLERAGDLAGTPVFLGCDAEDFHIPADRVRESAEVLAKMGARVDCRIYEGIGHTVVEDEIRAVRQLLTA